MTMFPTAEQEPHRAYRDRARTELRVDAFDVAYERGAQATDDTVWELALASLD